MVAHSCLFAQDIMEYTWQRSASERFLFFFFAGIMFA